MPPQHLPGGAGGGPRRRLTPPLWLHWAADPCDGVKGLERPRGAALVEITGQVSAPRASSSACALGSGTSASMSRCAAHPAQCDVEEDPVAVRGRRRVREGGGGRRRLIASGFRGGVRTTGARDARRGHRRASPAAHLHAVPHLPSPSASVKGRSRKASSAFKVWHHPQHALTSLI